MPIYGTPNSLPRPDLFMLRKGYRRPVGPSIYLSTLNPKPVFSIVACVALAGPGATLTLAPLSTLRLSSNWLPLTEKLAPLIEKLTVPLPSGEAAVRWLKPLIPSPAGMAVAAEAGGRECSISSSAGMALGPGVSLSPVAARSITLVREIPVREIPVREASGDG